MRLPWTPQALLSTKVVITVAIASLFTSFTNLIPISATVVTLFILSPFLIIQQESQHKLIISLLLLWGYFALSTLLYSPKAFTSYDFFRRDGKFFISFAPLLLLGSYRLRIDTDLIIKYFITITTTTNLLLLSIFAATGGTIWIHEHGIYHGLFVTHNAAGGFMAFSAACSIGYYFATKHRLLPLSIIINLTALFATDSRGAMLAILAANATVFIAKEKRLTLIVAIIILSQLVFLSWLYSQSAPSIFLGSSEQIDPSHLSDYTNRGWTILQRTLVYWPRAIYLWLESPIVGTGFGSYNDFPYNLSGMTHLFAWNSPSKLTFNEGHAHHTFLHVAAETGLVGLLLLINVLRHAFKFIYNLSNTGLRTTLSLALWVAIFTAFTENGLFIPSLMIPITILLGLSLANERWISRQRTFPHTRI